MDGPGGELAHMIGVEPHPAAEVPLVFEVA
jgi:hypothetical protein